MLKGKTQIELTNVNTGEVEKYEDENIITDAVQRYINMDCILSSQEKILNENYLWNHVLGGIRLFEKTIAENASNWQMPSLAENKTVGYANDKTSDGTDKYRGSRNIAETKFLDNGVQIVWDFATSEANGTISCVCLTPTKFGEKYVIFPIEQDQVTMFGKSNYSYLGMDTTNNQYIYLNYKARPYILERYELNTKIDICNGLYSLKLVSSTPIKGVDINSENRLSYAKMADEKTLYIVTGTTINFYDINSFNKIKTININVPYKIDDFNGFIRNDYFYTLKSNESSCYEAICKININNVSDITIIELPQKIEYGRYGTWLHYPIFHANGDVSYGTNLFNPESNIVIKVPINYGTTGSTSYAHYFYEKGEASIYCMAGSLSIYASFSVLMSINNLQIPVIKTADKTMKITYTITEV